MRSGDSLAVEISVGRGRERKNRENLMFSFDKFDGMFFHLFIQNVRTDKMPSFCAF